MVPKEEIGAMSHGRSKIGGVIFTRRKRVRGLRNQS
ncbi:hypothetical protein O206_20975 [Ochrobactrum sp. EGD-AQ16]|nr:hypothetical protein O206_20975 [Ochrobactrum sp. EGD-AQ16]